MGIGSIRGIKTSITKLRGFRDVLYHGDPVQIARAKQLKKDTLYSCKPLKVDCEFCQEKIGLLNDDVFTKSSKNSDKK